MFRGALDYAGPGLPFQSAHPRQATREMTVTQSEMDRTGPRLSSRDICLQWPDTYRPECPVCGAPTIGLVDRGRYIQRTLQLKTVAEPCGCDVTTHAQAMQTDAVRAGAVI